MVAPYLSRLRPAESGLRPRPRSRFEPALTLPIDGLAIDGLAGAGPGLSSPPPDAGLSGAEAELGPDPAGRPPAGPATAVGDRQLPPAWAGESTPGPGLGPRSTPAARPAPREDDDPAYQRPAGPAGTAVLLPPAAFPPAAFPGAFPPGPPRHRLGPLDPAGARPGGIGTGPEPAGGREDSGPARPAAGRRLTAPPPATTPDPAPEPGPAVQDRALARSAWRPGGPPASPAPPPPVPSPAGQAPREARYTDQLAGAAAERVQAIARQLGDADTALRREGPAAPPPGPRQALPRQALPRQALPGRAPGQPAPPPPDVTVTIGRIEVKMPAAEPAPARREPSGAGRRVPSLEDYLASRARARGRPG
jgi:hypothetical protein